MSWNNFGREMRTVKKLEKWDPFIGFTSIG
jgi:hypothetical protein